MKKTVNVNEIISAVDEALQDSTVSPSLTDINHTISYIAALSYLPELLTAGVVNVSATATLTVAGATNAEPIVLSFATAHGLDTGAVVAVTDVTGNTNANGTWYIEKLTDTTFSLLNSAGNAEWISGGTVVNRPESYSLPDNYQHDLIEAFSVVREKSLAVRSNLRALESIHPDTERRGNDIEDVAVEANNLYCRPVPDIDDILMCKYYRKPTDLVTNTESPACIPEHLHEMLIVQHLAFLRWPLIEDGEDGKTPNTDKAAKKVSSGMMALRLFYPRPSMIMPRIKRKFNFF